MNSIRSFRASFVAFLLLPTTVSGQSFVSGQLSILEKDGVRSNDLSNAVIWLESVGSDAPSRPTSVQIAMESRQFVPRVQVVPVGSTVEYPNHDPFRHNVFSKSGPAEFDLGLYARGERRPMRFERPGVYPIFCNIHAKMVAYVIAITSPWSVRPGADGRFSVASIPPGSYTLKVWHDRGGRWSRLIVLPNEGVAPLTIQLDARSYQPAQHKNKFGKAYTTTGSDRY